MRETWSIPRLGRFPWRRAWQPTPVFLPGASPWTEEPGLQSMGSQRVTHDWGTKLSTAHRWHTVCLWAHQVNVKGLPVVSREGLTAWKIASEAVALWTERWKASFCDWPCWLIKGLPWWLSRQRIFLQWVDTWVLSLGREDPLEEGNPLQYSCLENSTGRGAWYAIVHGVAKSQTQLKQLRTAHLIKNSTETLWGFPGSTVVRN